MAVRSSHPFSISAELEFRELRLAGDSGDGTLVKRMKNTTRYFVSRCQASRKAASDTKPALTLASATLDAPVVVSNDDSSTLDKTSLIGKIFIACGGLLTLASAARMFIA